MELLLAAVEAAAAGAVPFKEGHTGHKATTTLCGQRVVAVAVAEQTPPIVRQAARLGLLTELGLIAQVLTSFW
jgi:hypothetical protein